MSLGVQLPSSVHEVLIKAFAACAEQRMDTGTGYVTMANLCQVDWFLLFNHAASVSTETLHLLPNLDYVEAGICERENLPSPTMTQRFIRKYGADIVNAADPPYEISRIPNVACLSSVLVRIAPPGVKEVRVSGANLSDLREWATINRLLSFSYDLPTHLYQERIERLTLDVRGAAGIQSRTQAGLAIGSPGMCKHWRDVISMLPALKHLRLNGHWSQGLDTHATDPSRLHRRPRSCLLSLLLSETTPLGSSALESLYLDNFVVDHSTLEKFVSNFAGTLKRLVFSNLTLKCPANRSWKDFMEALRETAPEVESTLR